MLEKLNLFRLTGVVILVLLIWKRMGLFLRKNHYLRCWVSLDWSSYIVSIPKSASKKIGTSIRSMKFLSPEVVLYLYKSTIRPALQGYCCHVWAGAPSCFLEMLDKLQNGYIYDCWSSTCCVSWTLGSSPICSQLKSFYYRYYFGKCSSELAQLIPLIFSRGRSTRYSDRLCVFSVIITRCYEGSILTVSFLAQLDSGILCPYNAFLLPIISLALSLELSRHLFL